MYLLFSESLDVFFCIHYEIRSVVIRGLLQPLVNKGGQLVLVVADLHDRWSCATPVVPELGGKVGRNPPSLRSSTVPSRSVHIPVRVNSYSSRRSSPPSRVFSPPSGDGKKK